MLRIQLAHQGVMAYARRWPLRQQAIEEGQEEQQRLIREGWTVPVTAHPADAG